MRGRRQVLSMADFNAPATIQPKVEKPIPTTPPPVKPEQEVFEVLDSSMDDRSKNAAPSKVEPVKDKVESIKDEKTAPSLEKLLAGALNSRDIARFIVKNSDNIKSLKDDEQKSFIEKIAPMIK